MSEPKITLQQILDEVAKRPPNPDLELATVEFLDRSDAEQRAILFRELCWQGGQLNWLLAQFGMGPAVR